MSSTGVVGSKGEILIPTALRKRCGLTKGTHVIFREESGRVIVELDKYAELFAMQGSLSHLPLEEELQKERAAEREREDKKFPDFDPLTALAGT